MRIASIQSNVTYGDPAENSNRAVEKIGRLAEQGVQFAVLPECYLTGYCVSSKEEATAIAITKQDPALQVLQECADRSGVTIVVGFAEGERGLIYNSVALFEPEVEPRYYRKTHLPHLGLDRHVTPGDRLGIFETKLGRVGILICFDQRFPEPARTLTLKGVDLIVVPTNWPDGAQVSADYISIARAAENRVWMATCDRVGDENGFHFIGKSKIISPTGQVVASAQEEETILLADIDLTESRLKRNIVIPGLYETDVIGARRPELYANS